MKKRFLSLLFVLFLVPGIFMFVGCNRDNSYKLSNLKTDFESLANNYENVNYLNGKFVFDYSQHKYNGKQYLVEAIEKSEPYNVVTSYNTVFDNIMLFVYDHIEILSSDEIQIETEVRNNLKEKLDEFRQSIGNVNLDINQWAEVMKYPSPSSLYKFKALLDSYSDMFQKAIGFSNTIADIYYNYALNDANPRIDTMNSQDVPALVISRLKGRIKYQISNLTQCFIEKNINRDLSSILTTQDGENYPQFNLDNDGYISKVNQLISKEFDVNVAIEYAKNEEKVDSFREIAIKAYNLQNVLDNDNEKFITACKKIDYSKVNNESSMQDRLYKQIIDDYSYHTHQYNSVIIEMFAPMGVN